MEEEERERLECPPSLLQHCRSQIRSGLRIDQSRQDLDSFLSSFVDEILCLGRDRSHSAKGFRAWVSETTDLISKCFLVHPEIVDLVFKREMTVEDVIRYWESEIRRNENIFDDITSVHRSLIELGCSHSKSDESNRKYSLAAHEMGKKAWVIGINQWMEEQVLKFFRFGGARRRYLKSHFDQQDHLDELDPDLFSNGMRVSILDVGSCYNYFLQSKNANQLDVTALDLCPAHESVFVGDFLTLEVGSCFRSIELGPSGTNSSRQITQLPKSSFDAVTMSLVLSYLPTSFEREVMVSRARLLLIGNENSDWRRRHHRGLLVIAEKASIFPPSHKKGECEASPREWIDCICNLGFELVTYQNPMMNRRQVHLFAFCLSSAPLSPAGSHLKIRNEDSK